MAAYQLFDHYSDKTDWGFFKDCLEKKKLAGQFYLCIMEYSKAPLDPIVTSFGMSEIPGPSPKEEEGDQYHHCMEDQNKKLVATQQDANELYDMSNNRIPVHHLQSADGKKTWSNEFRTMVGEDLMPVVGAANDWIRRVTSCKDPICERLKEFRDYFATWGESAVNTVSSALHLSGCLFFIVSILGFASYDAVLAFPQERALFNREVANGLYSPSSYFIAKNVADFPFQVVPSFVMSVIYYFMVGFDKTVGQFVCYFVTCCMTTFCAYGFGYMVSAGSARMEIAIVIAPLTLGIWLALGGFFLRDGDIPQWIQWFKYLSFYRWSFFALVTNQFPMGGYFGALPNALHLTLSGVPRGGTVAYYVSMLCSISILFRVIGLALLVLTNRTVGLEM